MEMLHKFFLAYNDCLDEGLEVLKDAFWKALMVLIAGPMLLFFVTLMLPIAAVGYCAKQWSK